MNIVSTATGWEAIYAAQWWSETTNDWENEVETIKVSHSNFRPNCYEKTIWQEHGVKSNGVAAVSFEADKKGTVLESGAKDSSSTVLVKGQELFAPFTGSDFWICDLGLEFFHWPQQKILPKTTSLKRGREYTLLESTNPNPGANGYSRVVTWIDKETGGILEAEAYDARNKLLKVFEPKSFKNVNGQWELQEMEIRNVQTGSRTKLEFDLNKQ